mmetsp:Transcript_27748/g.42041  ORF Transcript_27748/g.42041 Transcript_27748/m.42041 type:complete len:84 (+) Transcript_27748:437-688(+)
MSSHRDIAGPEPAAVLARHEPTGKETSVNRIHQSKTIPMNPNLRRHSQSFLAHKRPRLFEETSVDKTDTQQFDLNLSDEEQEN